MSGGKNSPPPSPDYAGLAAQQGQESRDTAQYNNAINRVDQYTPYGNSTWTTRPGADPNNPQPGDYIQNMQLSPEQQQLYDSQNQISQSMLQTGLAGMGRVGQAQGQPFDMSQVSQFYGAPSMQNNAQANVPYGQLGQGYQTSVNPGQVQGQIDMSGVRSLGSGADDASRQRVEEAMMARANPDFARQEEDTRTRLLNSGMSMGSDAWNSEMGRMDQARNDMRMQSVLAGGQEESRQVGLNAGLQQQEYGQALGRGQFANQANAQQFGQNLGAAQFGNQALQQQAQFANQAQGQQFSQQQAIDNLVNSYGLQQAQFGNQARQQSMQEQAYLRQLPLNELNALRSGGQVQNPQFANYYTGGQAQASPYFDAGVAQGNYDLGQYNQQQGGFNNLMGGLANLGSSAIFRYSDRRLKANARRVNGLWHTWQWADGSPGFGVMADEMPADAVRYDAAGFAMVDYAKVPQ